MLGSCVQGLQRLSTQNDGSQEGSMADGAPVPSTAGTAAAAALLPQQMFPKVAMQACNAPWARRAP